MHAHEVELREKLAVAFPGASITLADVSAAHAGHAGAQGFSGGSHFELEIASNAFKGLNTLARHRQIYAALGNAMERVHALAIKAHTL
jgi:BolA family transcriptional regulator, general stress-responsive regulator